LAGGAKFSYKASGKGDSLKLTAEVTPKEQATLLKWTSSDPKVATVDANGLVTFRGKEGKVTITVTAGDKTEKIVLESVKHVTGVGAPQTKLYIRAGKSLTLLVALTDSTRPSSYIDSKLTWKSSNKKALTVSAKGKIKANKKLKKRTNVTVTATAANGKSLKFKVTVVPKTVKLRKLTVKAPKRMKVGAVYQLKVNTGKATGVKLMFRSSNNAVVKVSKAGKLVAVKKGKARIFIKAGGKKIRKVITVK
jgi:uncharacterized protein YjdB